MAAYLIAQIGQLTGRSKKHTILGYRLLDVASGKTLDTDIKSLKHAIKTNSVNIENIGLDNGYLCGTNGSIDRYSILEYPDMTISDGTAGALVVLYQVEDFGYLVSNPVGMIREASKQDVIVYASSNGIANGKLVTTDGKTILSAISGSYPVISLEQLNTFLKSKGMKSKLYSIYGMSRELDKAAENTQKNDTNELEKDTVAKQEQPKFGNLAEDFKNKLRVYYRAIKSCNKSPENPAYNAVKNINIEQEVENLDNIIKSDAIVDNLTKNEWLLHVVLMAGDNLRKILPGTIFEAISGFICSEKYPIPESAQEVVRCYCSVNMYRTLELLYPCYSDYIAELEAGAIDKSGVLDNFSDMLNTLEGTDERFILLESKLLSVFIERKTEASKNKVIQTARDIDTYESDEMSVTDTESARTIVSNNPIEAMKVPEEELDAAATKETADTDAKVEKPEGMSKAEWYLQLKKEASTSDLQGLSYSHKIADDMMRRKLDYRDMSQKQRYHFEKAISELEELKAKKIGLTVNKDKKKIDKVSDAENITYQLDSNPDIKAKVNRIISMADTVEMQQVLDQTPNVIKICYSILRFGKASTRQLKHVDLAISILDNQ
mgnify:CR=1 FL=1